MTTYYTQAQIDEIGALIGQEIVSSSETLKQFVQDKIAALEPVTPPAPTEPEAGDGTTPAPAAGMFLDDGREIKKRMIKGTTPKSWEPQFILQDTGLDGNIELVALEVLTCVSGIIYTPPSSHPDALNTGYSANLEKHSGMYHLRLNNLGAATSGSAYTAVITYLA